MKESIKIRRGKVSSFITYTLFTVFLFTVAHFGFSTILAYPILLGPPIFMLIHELRLLTQKLTITSYKKTLIIKDVNTSKKIEILKDRIKEIQITNSKIGKSNDTQISIQTSGKTKAISIGNTMEQQELTKALEFLNKSLQITEQVEEPLAA